MFAKHDAQFQPDLSNADRGILPSGLMPSTRVETEAGWLPAKALRPGMGVYTVDGGLREVLDICRGPGAREAIRVPGGVLGNDAEVHLAPGQLVLLSTGAAIDWLGTPVALARAEDLVGHRGIARRAAPFGRVVTPLFAEEEILWAATGLRLYAPSVETIWDPEHFIVLDRAELKVVLGR